MIEVGRVVMKVAGRDAGKVGVMIKVLDDNYVMIDGEVRRRKCNINHLEILNKTVEIKEDATNAEVVKALVDAGISAKEKVDNKKTAGPRPRQVRLKNKVVEEKPAKKSAPKAKAAPKKEAKKETKKETKVAPKKEEKKAEKKPEAATKKPAKKE